MRLLNTQTLKFGEFFDKEIPKPYYILSHTWTRDEISFKEYSKGRNQDSSGYRKVDDFCTLVQGIHGPSWVWVDTICIDKRSSAELTEAINSMWNWYWNAEICYAYLDDVTTSAPNTEIGRHEEVSSLGELRSQVESSKWFTRGWTLQELLAPEQLIFVNRDWQIFGLKRDPMSYHNRYRYAMTEQFPIIVDALSKVTGIHTDYLSTRNSIGEASIACRLSWAARRETTRREDKAYCLLGLMDINMPLLYGEGDRAFRRLQEELVKSSDDQSIFAWRSKRPNSRHIGMLAREPADFKNCNHVSRKVAGTPLCTLEMAGRDIKVQGCVQTYEVDFEGFREFIEQAEGDHLGSIFLRMYERNKQGNLDLIRLTLGCYAGAEYKPVEIILARHAFGTNEAFVRFVFGQYVTSGTSRPFISTGRATITVTAKAAADAGWWC
ncbi:hypothetical protein CKM354_000619700 [Cercospora kikuchii]|uniref:Heterokaryon incompatibility domain-containing protein n=1 Tax=Cercospora kikuchii TaxID=84275 RepID=A0A9P3CM07_9PEZI|nr:uncharacterized protein CKM354_000619700 [Cercospora kikuchii]GIZ42950.1 hypothetical protein CKM354_000619700 [Cercospora kikuchii]